ncbi:unnamed protein product [Triticum turgidum subsp. durum]|uniref:6-phosphogluconate dehydrogenase, decarboxylating n=1 Tax=Triticum turgidum subsp. durum TaxID=4567 RepID=A0A9R0QGT6_TRITD|nr:unnamed protein product [Triticum turgidum subsp. durum]
MTSPAPAPPAAAAAQSPPPRIGLAGLATMGQNLALNIAEKGFPISVYNRTAAKVDSTLSRAAAEGALPVLGHRDPRDFVLSLARPRTVVLLVQAGPAVDATIDALCGEEGARNGPSLMPGGDFQAYSNIKDILEKAAAQTEDGPCVTFVGPGGAGNFVKMVHNGIEYGDMQLIAEAYDVLHRVGGLSNSEIADVFAEWNKGELESFLVEITADIFTVADPLEGSTGGALVDKILDKTGMKGTGKWTVQQAAELAVAAPTIAASLDGRYLSGLKDERVAAASVLEEEGMPVGLLEKINVDKKVLVDRVRQALYSSKVCSYAQGMNLLRAKSVEQGWNLNLAELSRIWKGGCIIRARFLDRIKKAYDRNPELANLIVDREFAREMVQRQGAWRWVVARAVEAGISTPGMSASLSYFDTYRCNRLPANLIQAQRDLFGAHTYERIDRPGSFHTEWSKLAREGK